jgi:hypothetical protein
MRWGSRAGLSKEGRKAKAGPGDSLLLEGHPRRASWVDTSNETPRVELSLIASGEETTREVFESNREDLLRAVVLQPEVVPSAQRVRHLDSNMVFATKPGLGGAPCYDKQLYLSKH